MIGIIAVGTAVRDVFAKRTAQARAPPAVEVVLLSYISWAKQHDIVALKAPETTKFQTFLEHTYFNADSAQT